LRVLIAATFREKKGIPYALEALGRLQKDIPLEVTLVGDSSNELRSQKEKQKILATIDKYRLASNVNLLGFQSHDKLLEIAYQHHLFISPSITADDGDTEGGAPIAIIEMVATGMPIVSTTHCDIPGVVQPDLKHLLAKERDVEGLIQAIEWLVSHHEEWLSILENGRRYVESEFDAYHQGKRLSKLYHQVVNT
jgi:colanic acid/amylovoran biosynthesis glycosyltransferase